MVNILILSWKSAEDAKECIMSVSASDNRNFRVILINNFSSESDQNEIHRIFESFSDKLEIYLVQNQSNLGYAGGNNSGFEFLTRNRFGGDILILNPDVRISPDTISELTKALTGSIGIVSPRIMNSEGKIMLDALKLKGYFQKKVITDQYLIATDYSQGSCFLIKRAIADNTGLFDERFFLYWEEVDLSLRTRKSGWELISVTTTSVVRKRNFIDRQPLAFYYSVRNSKLIKEKHPDFFSNGSQILYLIKMLLLTVKFIPRPQLFLSVISNYFAGIRDSINNNYYSKDKTQKNRFL
jgi:GT2 family glycosyltransferase